MFTFQCWWNCFRIYAENNEDFFQCHRNIISQYSIAWIKIKYEKNKITFSTTYHLHCFSVNHLSWSVFNLRWFLWIVPCLGFVTFMAFVGGNERHEKSQILFTIGCPSWRKPIQTIGQWTEPPCCLISKPRTSK